MNIAYIMSRFPSITETFVLYEILEMEKYGYTVHIFPLLKQKTQVVHPEVQGLLPRTRYTPFISMPIIMANVKLFCNSPWKYMRTVFKILRGVGGSANFLFGALGILPKSFYFAREMEKLKIAHVHAHFSTHPVVSALIIKEIASIPYSFTGHGSDIHVRQRMYDTKVRESSFAVMISNYNKLFLENIFGPDIGTKMKVIHCGIDPDYFIPPEGSDHDSVHILCVATFRPVKGHRYLIEACRILKERGLDFECHLVGQGRLRGQIEKQVMESSLTDRVIFHGPMARPDLIEMMRSTDMVVLPSVLTPRGTREGIPVTLMEAMALERPIVSSRLSGIPELVEDGVSGLLAPPRDSQALADAIEKLGRDPQLREQLGKAGRQRVIQDFNLKTNTSKLAELIEESIKSSKAGNKTNHRPQPK